MSLVVLLCAKSLLAVRLWLAVVLVAKLFDAVVVCDELDCSAACCANRSVVDVAACCWAPTEALWLKLLVVAVEAPKLELSWRPDVLEWLALSAALFVRLALLVRAAVELPWLELALLLLEVVPLLVVVDVFVLLPAEFALLPPVFEALVNVSVPAMELALPVPVELPA